MRRWRLLGLAMLLLAVAAGTYHFRQTGKLPFQDKLLIAPSAVAAAPRVHVGRAWLPAPVRDMAMDVHGSYPMPTSEWQAKEAKLNSDLFTARRFEVLVVPFQVQIYGFDRPTRSLMTAELSRAIGRAGREAMPDPFLVERALGDGARRFRPESVLDLASHIGANRLIWCYVGHTLDGKMTITIKEQKLTRRSGRAFLGRAVIRNYDHLAFSDEHPALEVYRAMLPRLLKDLGFDANAASPRRVESSFTDDELPETAFGLTRAQASPARDAYYLQLLGTLTPRREELERERLFEKSLLAVERMTRDSPQYRALKARAYLHIGLRPAALKVLGTPATTEEKALHAALDGNLPELKGYIAKERRLVPRMLEMLEANAIAADYGAISQKDAARTVASLDLPGEIWPVVAARAFTDWDEWSQQDNLVLKHMLDQELPVQGYTAEGIVQAAVATGDLDTGRTRADLAVLEHVKRLLVADPAKWCCDMPDDRPTQRDYLDFINATATDNLMRRANFYTVVQGRPASALDFLRRIQAAYDGYPEFALERAKAENAQAQQAQGVQKDGEMRAALLDGLNAAYWSDGQTRVAAKAVELTRALRRADFGPVDNWYATDLPFRSFFPGWGEYKDGDFTLRNARAALNSSVSDFGPVRHLAQMLRYKPNGPQKTRAILDSLRDRFAGCSERDAFLAYRSLEQGDFAAAESHYRDGIKDAPSSWLSYDGLGTALFQEGKPRQAAQAFMSYPGFRPGSGENAVGLSNEAYEAGSYFYWSGDFALARPLYRMAADLDTGSDASLASRLRLDLLDGNYRAAMQGLLTRARRYNVSYAYRDYLGMLHAMGQSASAWSAFDALVPQLRASQIWETALVGHRIARASESDIAAWASQERFKNDELTREFAALYLVRAGITDRTPGAALERSVGALAWPAWRVPDYDDGAVVRAGDSDGVVEIVGPTEKYGDASVSTQLFAGKTRVPVKSDLAYFVAAYRALRLGDASRAVAIFKEATSYYDPVHPDLRYLLSYYAFAAAKAGDLTAVENQLARFDIDQRQFDYYLAKAVIAGLAGRTEDSLQLLHSALYRRPYTERRPVYSEYQYAETVEWLYRDTGKPQYRDLALDWVKKVERFTPWYAWPYAMQAELDRDEAGRRRAIAMAAYLDPGSERLAKLPKAEVARAVRVFKGLNPFLQLSANVRKSGI